MGPKEPCPIRGRGILYLALPGPGKATTSVAVMTVPAGAGMPKKYWLPMSGEAGGCETADRLAHRRHSGRSTPGIARWRAAGRWGQAAKCFQACHTPSTPAGQGPFPGAFSGHRPGRRLRLYAGRRRPFPLRRFLSTGSSVFRFPHFSRFSRFLRFPRLLKLPRFSRSFPLYQFLLFSTGSPAAPVRPAARPVFGKGDAGRHCSGGRKMSSGRI